MYNLGDNFKVDYKKAKMNPNSIVVGQRYRITVLTERMLRLEYNNSGKFEDRPTEFAWYRNLPKPDFKVENVSNKLVITTKYFKLIYEKNKPFKGTKINPTDNLKIELNGTDKVWYYGHPEIRNYSAPSSFLEDVDSKDKMKSLYSTDGFVSIDDSNTDIMLEDGTFTKRDGSGQDIYLIMYGNQFEQALKDYFEISSYPSLIPRYALGNWWSRNNNYNDLELRKLIDNFEDNEIPLSIIVLDKDWHIKSYKGSKILKTGFTFDNKNFKNPIAMINFIHSKGIRIGLNVDPTEGITKMNQYYNEALKYVKPDDNGVIPFNVLDPEFVDVYLKLFIHPLDNIGIDFFWIDSFDNIDINNLSKLKHYHFYDMTRDYKKRPMVLAYNSLIAAHRYPVLYSGKTTVSWDTLKKIPYHNLSAANIGVSWWSHDIGGYHNGIEDNELYIKFIQLGTFSPILKFGAEKGKYYKREPWRWNIKTYTIAKEYLQLRHKMIPYLYSEAYKYHKEGKPIIVPLYYKYPDYYYDDLYKNEYSLGTEFFVVPIVKKKDYLMDRTIQKLFVPKGTWYDFFTGKKFPGDKEYVTFYKDQDYPVFAREGAIIPMGKNDNMNDTTPPKNMEIQIFPGCSNSYKLYEDDGVSNLYQKDYYLLTSIDFNCLKDNYTVVVRATEGKSGIVPDKRNYKIIFRNTNRASAVSAHFNNEPLSCKTHLEGLNFVVEIEDVNTIGQLTINIRGIDLAIDAVRLVNEDIEKIISDLQIETVLKEQIDKILFSTLTIRKKRIEIRKLERKKLDRKFVKLFLKLLEYVEEI